MTPAKRTNDRSLFEFLVLGLSALAIVAVVVTLVVQGFKERPSRPDLSAIVSPASNGSGGVTYMVVVRNDGGETAEHVVVEVTVGAESRETELAAVARGDEEQATVVFPAGTTGPAQAEILSYTESSR